MQKQIKTEYGSNVANPSRPLFVLGIIGLASPFLTFILAVSSIPYSYKMAGLVVVAAAYLSICIWLYKNLPAADAGYLKADQPGGSDEANEETEGKLLALAEANQFFGSSLNAADMFRLVSSRVGEIFPFAACALFVPDETGGSLSVAQFEGRNAEVMRDLEIDLSEGLSGKAFASGSVEIDEDLMLDRWAMAAENLKGFRSAAAIPLLQDEKVFGVFVLFMDCAIKNDESTLKLLGSVGEHVTPVFRSSMAFEQSISSALTDVLTGLPNERAFYMILENQLAECMRYRDERPLTVLTIDIKGFAEVNEDLGHRTGDRMLEFTGERIKEQLRKMDFLARTGNDEFALILPTASEKTALEIMDRIKIVFAETPFQFSEEEKVKIWLNFGWATFWKDGETASQLVRHAQLRKQQAKSEEPAGVLWFPKEYVN